MPDDQPCPESPLVSAIIATFNQRDVVIRAIRSVLAQSYARCEIIVQDDGSDDGTAEAIAAIAGQGLATGRIDYRRQAHCGIAAARNNAIRRSRGELMALLDADDVWTPDKLEECVRSLHAHPEADVVYSPVSTVAADGRQLSTPDGFLPKGWLIESLFERNCIHDSTAVFRRRVWERVGGFDESLRVCVGHNFWLRVAMGHCFGVIPQPLVVCTHFAREKRHSDRLPELVEGAKMLYDFYESQGGNDRLERSRACQAIARACRAAGWAALLAGNGTISELAFSVATTLRPSPLARLLWLAATIQRRWRRQPVYSATQKPAAVLG